MKKRTPRKTVLTVAVAALACACGPEYPEPYPREVRLSSSLAEADGDAVNLAIETWNASFPGCPHEIVSVEPIKRGSYTAGDLGYGPVLPERPQTTARYNHPKRWIEITELAVERGTTANGILHELGHGHNVYGHTDSGIMRAGDSADTTIDDAMRARVCWFDRRCCD